MPNNLNVTLNKTPSPWAVDVNQQGNANHVSRSPNAQTITWELTGNAASGFFVSLSDPNPGFSWVGTPPADTIFSLPTLSANGNQLSIIDLNNSASTTGTWTYMLRVNVGGTVYTTISTLPYETDTNPTIKNN
jgi:hypothetical protein